MSKGIVTSGEQEGKHPPTRIFGTGRGSARAISRKARGCAWRGKRINQRFHRYAQILKRKEPDPGGLEARWVGSLASGANFLEILFDSSMELHYTARNTYHSNKSTAYGSGARGKGQEHGGMLIRLISKPGGRHGIPDGKGLIGGEL